MSNAEPLVDSYLTSAKQAKLGRSTSLVTAPQSRWHA